MSKIEKLLNKVSRRSSDTSLDPNPSIVISSENSPRALRNRAKSMSLAASSSSSSLVPISSNDGRLRSKSVSKKHTKELIKYETKQVVTKKLTSILNELGLQQPIPLEVNRSNSSTLAKSISIYVANSNNCIYLAPASSASFTYEDVENGGVAQDSGIPVAEDDYDSADDAGEAADPTDKNEADPSDVTDDPGLRNIPPQLRTKLEKNRSPNHLCTTIDSDTPIPHTFAVIVELNKDTSINLLKFEFCSLTNILWPSGDPYNKSYSKEKFKIGKLDWIKTLDNADYYINNLNSNDFRARKMDPSELAKRTRYYKLNKAKDMARHFPESDDEEDDLEYHYDEVKDGQTVYKAGIYVFLLPVILPEHIPPTISSINGSLNHILSVSIHKSSDKLNRKLKLVSNYNLPMVRTPPSFANSIADKPIYVNRIWNDALHYIITFPRKYVSLGSEHSINVKIVPLAKDVVIKRIKFNVLERISYISGDLSREYDYDSEDPYYLRPNLVETKVRERIVSVCELKTKNKPSNGNTEPYKEEVIKCPDNNLLFSCYEPDTSITHSDDIANFKLDDNSPHLKKKSQDPENCMIASPLDINIALPFLTTRSDKLTQTASYQQELRKLSASTSHPSSRKASIMSSETLPSSGFSPSSPVIGALETNLTHNHSDLLIDDDPELLTPDHTALMHEVSHNHTKENIQQGFTTVSRALYPDSNFRHIQIHHRLQVCFRISKPDPKDNFKMHHYEVVVDTPLILLSSKCNEASVQLPKYDEVDLHPPIASPSSPLLAPMTSQNSISFRTPNFNKDENTSKNGGIKGNGFSIKTWDQGQDDDLPTFEEATSPVSSPITRSISVGEDPLSRVPSISSDNALYSPSVDPPAYDDGEEVYKSPLNIDAIVNQDRTTDSKKSLAGSRLRSSLVNSFAPTASSSESSTSNLRVRNVATELSEASPLVALSSNAMTLDSSTNLSMTSSTSQKMGNSNSSVSLDSEAIPIKCGSAESLLSSNNSGNVPDDSSNNQVTDDSSNNSNERPQPIPQKEYDSNVYPMAENPETGTATLMSLPDVSDTNLSIKTNYSTFDQRVPLLRNTSTESNLPLSTSMSATNPNKLSTDNLSIITENQAKDIYHAY